jgi:hypothetical protein
VDFFSLRFLKQPGPWPERIAQGIRLGSSDPQKNAKKIDKALTKMFQKFGPSAK